MHNMEEEDEEEKELFLVPRLDNINNKPADYISAANGICIHEIQLLITIVVGNSQTIIVVVEYTSSTTASAITTRTMTMTTTMGTE